MSTLENMPDDKTETVESPSKPATAKRETIQSMLGTAHEYADPALLELEAGAFERAIAEKHAADGC